MPVTIRSCQVDELYNIRISCKIIQLFISHLITIADFNIWKNLDPSLGYINCYPTYGMESSDLIESDELRQKFAKWIEKGSLEMSILSGLIEAKGVATYLNKQIKNYPESRVHITFNYHKQVKSMGINSTAFQNLQFICKKPKPGETIQATHYVTEIKYGAGGTFTLRKRIGQINDEWKIQSQLINCGNQLQLCMKRGSMAGISKENHEEDIKCDFKSDFTLPENVFAPSTYEEALEFASKLHQIVSHEKDGVPFRVSLYPLMRLPGLERAPVTVHKHFCIMLANRFVMLVENYEEMDEKAIRILNRDQVMVAKQNPISKKLQLFRLYIFLFRARLKKYLRHLLVAVRSGRENEDRFQQLLDRINNRQFAYNPERLDRWLTLVENESRIFCYKIINYLDLDDNRLLVFPQVEALQKQVTSVNYAFHLTFTSLSRGPDQIMEQMRNEKLSMINNIVEEATPSVVTANQVYWYDDESVSEQIKQNISVLNTLIKNSIGDKSVAFVITALVEHDEETPSPMGSKIVTYHEGKLLNESNASLHIAKIIIGPGIDIERKIKYNWNALHLVCRYYQQENLYYIVRYLINNGIEVNCKTKGGWNALLLLSRYYNKTNLYKIIPLLIEKGIDVNCTTKFNNNALTFLCRHYQEWDLDWVIKPLIEQKIEINCKDKDSWNALHFLCVFHPLKYCVRPLRLLVQHEIDKNAKTTNPQANDALSYVVMRFTEEEIERIIQILNYVAKNSIYFFLFGTYKKKDVAHLYLHLKLIKILKNLT